MTKINNVLSLRKIGTIDIGYLSFFEEQKDVPFDIKRIYYIYDVPKEINRGMHAHKSLKQMLWCIYGEIEITLDDGNSKESYLLDSPNKLLYVGNGIWHEMYWRKDRSVLCVVASDYYNEDDYIRDYDQFLKYVEKGCWKVEDKF